MKFGIGSYTLTWSVGVPGYDAPASPVTALDLLHIAHEHGIGLVQFADNLPLHTMESEELQTLIAASQTLGIELEVGTRGTAPEHLLTYLRLAKLMNTQLVRTLITTSNLHEAEQELREVLPFFEEAGVTLAIENHGMHTTRQLASLFDRLGSPFVGCCLDTVNSFSALDCPKTVIKDLLPYVVNLHLKDFDITRVDHQMGFVVLGKPAGCGKLDIPSLLADLRLAGKSPNVILELWTPFSGSVPETVEQEQLWFRQSLDNLKVLNVW
ncbi:MAG: sugar phosphate isomerase/epimerase [Gorillibacterium sp.]|nr:sugar phosphate isomerase/epimerase [Gorillibacterium sp.]